MNILKFFLRAYKSAINHDKEYIKELVSPMFTTEANNNLVDKEILSKEKLVDEEIEVPEFKIKIYDKYLIEDRNEELLNNYYSDTNKFSDLLNVMSNVTDQSVADLLHITSINPKASLVSDINTFAKKYNRQIKKKEQPIELIVPIYDTNQEGQKEIIGYQSNYVFDVSQTAGEKVENVNDVLKKQAKQNPDKVIETLKYLIPYPIIEKEVNDFHFDEEEQVIYMPEGLKNIDKIATLINIYLDNEVEGNALEVEAVKYATYSLLGLSTKNIVLPLSSVDSKDYINTIENISEHIKDLTNELSIGLEVQPLDDDYMKTRLKDLNSKNKAIREIKKQYEQNQNIIDVIDVIEENQNLEIETSDFGFRVDKGTVVQHAVAKFEVKDELLNKLSILQNKYADDPILVSLIGTYIKQVYNEKDIDKVLNGEIKTLLDSFNNVEAISDNQAEQIIDDNMLSETQEYNKKDYSELDKIRRYIRNNVSITDYIGKYLDVDRNGKCVCPFHDDNNPSMVVNEQKKIYKCFSCNEGGDVVKFVIEYHKVKHGKVLSIKDAMLQIANECNLSINTINRLKDLEVGLPADLKELAECNKSVNEVYSYYLSQVKDSEQARKYLTKKRGLSLETIKHFELGFAPSNDLQEKYFSDVESGQIRNTVISNQIIDFTKLYKTGVMSYDINESRRYNFAGRITVPIKDIYGNITGFGGRIIDTNHQSKYFNTNNNDLFKKGSILYNFNEVKQSTSTNIKIVEGYMDVISLYDKGVKDVVATMGTALTDQQIELLKSKTNRVTLMFDGDDVGIKATIENGEKLCAMGFAVDVVSLPYNEDPDSMALSLNKEGKDVGEYFKSKTVDFHTYKLDYLKNKMEDKNNVNDVIKLINDVISDIPESDIIKRNIITAKIVQNLDFNVKLLDKALNIVAQQIVNTTEIETIEETEEIY